MAFCPPLLPQRLLLRKRLHVARNSAALQKRFLDPSRGRLFGSNSSGDRTLLQTFCNDFGQAYWHLSVLHYRHGAHTVKLCHTHMTTATKSDFSSWCGLRFMLCWDLGTQPVRFYLYRVHHHLACPSALAVHPSHLSPPRISCSLPPHFEHSASVCRTARGQPVTATNKLPRCQACRAWSDGK